MYTTKKIHPALKHGGYAASRLLPGEDPDAFNKLHNDLIDELAPTGPLEEDIVFELARLLWRKQHLGTFQLAVDARRRRDAIAADLASKEGVKEPVLYPTLTGFTETYETEGDEEAWRDIYRRANIRARKELGDTYELISLGDKATTDELMKELAVEERLDALIEKNLKRLLLVRGIKSLAQPAEIAAPSRPKRLLRGV